MTFLIFIQIHTSLNIKVEENRTRWIEFCVDHKISNQCVSPVLFIMLLKFNSTVICCVIVDLILCVSVSLKMLDKLPGICIF